MLADDVEMGDVESSEVQAPAAGQTASLAARDIEMQTMQPATDREEQTVNDSPNSLLGLKCWQDLPPEAAGVLDNRWLLSIQQPDDNTQL